MPVTQAAPAEQPPARPAPPGRPKLPSWAAEPRAGRAGGWSRRTRVRAAIALGVVLFLAISILLARFLQTENVERDADLALIAAQARGDVQGMLDNLSGCRSNPGCVAAVKANAANPRPVRKGSGEVLHPGSPTPHAAFGATGRTRRRR